MGKITASYPSQLDSSPLDQQQKQLHHQPDGNHTPPHPQHQHSINLNHSSDITEIEKKEKSASEEPVIAVDIDEVLGQYIGQYIKFCNQTRGSNYQFSDFNSYDFTKVQNMGYDEIQDLCYAFTEHRLFTHEFPTVPGSVEGVEQLAELADIQIVTARRSDLMDVTHSWLNENFDIQGHRVHMGNHYDKNGGPMRKKSEMCLHIGADVLIEDSLGYAIDVASRGIPVVLFDLDGTYGWNKQQPGQIIPDNIYRVHSWTEAVTKAKEIINRDS